MGAITNIENRIHKQPNLEQLPVGHTHIILFHGGSNPRHTVQQSITQPLRQPHRGITKTSENLFTLVETFLTIEIFSMEEF